MSVNSAGYYNSIYMPQNQQVAFGANSQTGGTDVSIMQGGNAVTKTIYDPTCEDGINDGKIGFGTAVGSMAKGAVKSGVNMVKGIFTPKGAITTAAIVGVCCIPGIGQVIGAGLAIAGLAKGALTIGSGIIKANQIANTEGTTDEMAKMAFEDIGGGTLEVGLSVATLGATKSAASAAIKGGKAGAVTAAAEGGSKVAGFMKGMTGLDDAATVAGAAFQGKTGVWEATKALGKGTGANLQALGNSVKQRISKEGRLNTKAAKLQNELDTNTNLTAKQRAGIEKQLSEVQAKQAKIAQAKAEAKADTNTTEAAKTDTANTDTHEVKNTKPSGKNLDALQEKIADGQYANAKEAMADGYTQADLDAVNAKFKVDSNSAVAKQSPEAKLESAQKAYDTAYEKYIDDLTQQGAGGKSKYEAEFLKAEQNLKNAQAEVQSTPQAKLESAQKAYDTAYEKYIDDLSQQGAGGKSKYEADFLKAEQDLKNAKAEANSSSQPSIKPSGKNLDALQEKIADGQYANAKEALADGYTQADFEKIGAKGFVDEAKGINQPEAVNTEAPEIKNTKPSGKNLDALQEKIADGQYANAKEALADGYTQADIDAVGAFKNNTQPAAAQSQPAAESNKPAQAQPAAQSQPAANDAQGTTINSKQFGKNVLPAAAIALPAANTNEEWAKVYYQQLEQEQGQYQSDVSFQGLTTQQTQNQYQVYQPDIDYAQLYADLNGLSRSQLMQMQQSQVMV